MKVCPVCKSRCFDDMDTCYGCMHKFTDEQNNEAIENWSDDLIPEYFELDSSPIIEETMEIKHQIKTKPNHAKPNNDKIILQLEIPVKVLKNGIKEEVC